MSSDPGIGYWLPAAALEMDERRPKPSSSTATRLTDELVQQMQHCERPEQWWDDERDLAFAAVRLALQCLKMRLSNSKYDWDSAISTLRALRYDVEHHEHGMTSILTRKQMSAVLHHLDELDGLCAGDVDGEEDAELDDGDADAAPAAAPAPAWPAAAAARSHTAARPMVPPVASAVARSPMADACAWLAEHLTLAMQRFQRDYQPTEADQAAVEYVLRDMQAVADAAFLRRWRASGHPGCRELPDAFRPSMQLFGSAGNGFALAPVAAELGLGGSDLDLTCVRTWEARDEEAFADVSALRAVCKELQADRRRFSEVLLIKHARVPIIKLHHRPSGYNIDVCIDNTNAVMNTCLLKTYSRLDSRVLCLTYAVKRWLKARQLSSAPNGYLSSYSHTLMVIFLLQQLGVIPVLQSPTLLAAYRAAYTPEDGDYHAEDYVDGWDTAFVDDADFAKSWWATHRTSATARCGACFPGAVTDAAGRVTLPHSASPATVGELLMCYFRFYSDESLWQDYVISVRTGRLEPRVEWFATHEARMHDWRVGLEDPLEFHRDLGSVVQPMPQHRMITEFQRACGILDRWTRAYGSSRALTDQPLEEIWRCVTDAELEDAKRAWKRIKKERG